MSRFEKANAHFAVAYGVDHVTGTYCQVWLAPMEEQERAFVVIDNQGVYADTRAGRRARPGVIDWREVHELLATIRARFEQARGAGVHYPNIDAKTVADLFDLFGFPGMGAEVFRAFD
jgi:hypothetical protein